MNTRLVENGALHQSVSRGPAGGLFLHTGWRSGGTWLWSRCREQPGIRALYEPLHEGLGRLRTADTRKLRPGSWASNHSETAPYFEEFAPLLDGGRGVAGYRQRFAFDRFFMSADEQDPELEGYLAALIEAGGCRATVLKFCRSLGRVAWMEQHFPQFLHAVVLRDPLTQWASAQALLAEQRNRYFVTAPILVLARNAQHLLVREAASAFGLSLPVLYSDDIAYGIEACWRHLRRLQADERYRLHLAFWIICSRKALEGRATVVETGRIGTDSLYRSGIEEAFGHHLGTRFGLAADRAQSGSGLLHHSDRPPGHAEAHRTACDLLQDGVPPLAADRQAILLRLLGENEHGERTHTARRVHLPHAVKEPHANFPRRARTAVEVVLARLLQPVRRLHGTMNRFRPAGLS